MQGERPSLGYLTETLNFEHGSTSSNGVIDHWENIHSLGDNDLQDYMLANSESNTSLANSVYREQQDLRRFSLGEASSSGTKNESSSHSEQRRNDVIDLDPDFAQPSGTNQPVQNVNLNATYIEIHDDIDPNRDLSGFFEASGPGTRGLQVGRPFEESSVRTSSFVEGRHSSFKRKALEGSIGQSSSGGYRDCQHGESSLWTPTSTVYRPGTSLNISGPRGLVSGPTQNFPVSAIAESSSRNICVRNNPSDHQEIVNPATFSAGTVVRRPIPSSQSNLLRHIPVEQHSLDARPGQSYVFPRNPNTPALGIPPISRNMVPPFQWTEGSLAGGSSNSNVPVERNLHLDETRSRSISSNILESPVFVPAPELRNIARSQSSRNVTSGNLNIASSLSRTGSTTSVPPPPSNRPWTAYQNTPHYQRRRSERELVRRSLMSSLAVGTPNQRSGDHTTLRSLAPPASSDGFVLQPGGDNSQMHNRAYSRAGPWLDRQGDSVVGVPHSLRALAAASRGRSRLMMSQMQNVFDVMSRDNNNLRLEDVMLLNQSVLFEGGGGPGIHDRYRDMRLDVDNMSYEELLALGERIGDVCTGLSEETISNRLHQRKYNVNTKSPQDVEPCCICQEEYTEGEDMGTLECGHEFHSQCIKEWLKQKNLCPICKTTGLNTAKKRRIG